MSKGEFKVGDRVVLTGGHTSYKALQALQGREFKVASIEIAASSTKQRHPGSEFFLRLFLSHADNDNTYGIPDIYLTKRDDLPYLPEPEFDLDEINSVNI